MALPPQDSAKRLVSIYFGFATPTYRIVHEPSVEAWVDRLYDQQQSNAGAVTPVRQALILIIFATALLYETRSSDRSVDLTARSEKYYQAAQTILNNECGPVQLESAQARLATSLYLLNTSRQNRAWYTFGTTCQLLTALGLHRKSRARVAERDPIVEECRKRTFWSAYTVDGYFSVMLGRPHLLSDDDADQALPSAIDDNDIANKGATNSDSSRACVLTALIMHAKLARIFRAASKGQYSTRDVSGEEQVRKISWLSVRSPRPGSRNGWYRC